MIQEKRNHPINAKFKQKKYYIFTYPTHNMHYIPMVCVSGRVICDDCSQGRYKNERVCDFCAKAVFNNEEFPILTLNLDKDSIDEMLLQTSLQINNESEQANDDENKQNDCANSQNDNNSKQNQNPDNDMKKDGL